MKEAPASTRPPYAAKVAIRVETTPAKPTQGLELVMSLVKQMVIVNTIMMRVLPARIGLIISTLSIISNLRELETKGAT